MQKKIVLAFSGGLDTSFCTHYLKNNDGFEVETVIVNTGKFTHEELESLEKKAYSSGSSHHQVIDAAKEYYEQCIRFLIYGNVLRNRNYPVFISAERSFQALKVIQYAMKKNINTVAHGFSGTGNDQVCFEAIFQIMAPEIEILAPVRDLGVTREQELDYLIKAGVDFKFEKSRYSINHDLWGTTVGGKETLTSDIELPDDAFTQKEIKQETQKITIEFEKGEPVRLNDKFFNDPVNLIHELESVSAPFAIGRDTHVGETITGGKSRIGFQASSATLLINSHYSLEKHVLSKWQQYWKEQLGNWYGMLMHEGQLLEPSMRDIESFLKNSQRNVSGKVFIRLRPYHMQVIGVETPNDLMQGSFTNYGEETGSWTGEDVKGFTKILSNPLKIYYTINKDEKPE